MHRNIDTSLTWWDRVNNEYKWLRNSLGNRYKFERSIGVVIAIGDYIGDFKPLSSPAKDAVRMRDFLLNEAGFDEVHVLIDEDASSENIRHLMEDIIPDRVTEDDRLLLYWSGHGGSGKDSRDYPYGFLALQDASKDGKQGSIYMDEVRRWLRRIDARHVLFLIDACYSARALQMMSSGEDPVWEQMAAPAEHMLTSSGGQDVSYGYTDGSGGLFTTAFLRAARGSADANKDGLTTITEIASYLEPQLSKMTHLGFTQSPQFGAIGLDTGRFFFLSGHSPPNSQAPSEPKPIESSGFDACTAANADYEIFVRGAQDCLEVEIFLENHKESSDCTAVKAAERRKESLCEFAAAAPPRDPCSSVVPPEGMRCSVDPQGRAVFQDIVSVPLATINTDPVTLRVQTHYSPETSSGRAVAQFADAVSSRSGGKVSFEVFYSSSVVRSVDTFDAAATGILDCDMTGGGYQTGKDPAFWLVGDIYGGYETPEQQIKWLNFGDAEEIVQELYSKYGMHFVGWWIAGPESLTASTPIRGLEDVKGLKIRTPPGVLSRTWQRLGASPIVMDFTEIFTALETGILDGADASNLVNNVGLGLYDISRHTAYPGFHSMPSDHLACNKDMWDGLPVVVQNLIGEELRAMAADLAASTRIENDEAAREVRDQGVSIYVWSRQDRMTFRQAALDEFEATLVSNSLGQRLLRSHRQYMGQIGLLN
ncbi:TRAP transporter substrate-binding protein DctP [Roseobacter sp. A03A-229]